ncbi:MAG: hypothetical protein J7K68_00605, partial [Candidatus Diapherotrites archaeon]|nr:hypothetical protein [Candidatus Diapherotrites archaeon]
MPIRAIYSNLEDKFYAVMDALDAKGIPVYKVIDPIERAGIPAFPLTVGVLIIILGVLVYSFTGGAITERTVVVSVYDINGNAIDADVRAILNGEEIASGTAEGGTIELTLPNEKMIIEARVGECVKQEILDKDKKEIEITLECAMPQVAACAPLSEEKLITTMADRNNNIPTGCVLRVYKSEDRSETIETPFTVTPLGELDLSGQGTCPTENDYVVIDCNEHEWEGTVKELYNEIDMYGYLEVKVKPPEKNGANEQPPSKEGIVRSIYVKVIGEESSPLEGIILTVVSSDGTKLEKQFDNEVYEATTDANGDARLRINDGQEFYLQAKDPNGAYVPLITEQKFKADEKQSRETITIAMQRGFETNIYVKEEATQKILPGSLVIIYDENGNVVAREYADSEGKLKTTLLKDKRYTYKVINPLYDPVTGEIVGSEDTSAYTKQIDLTKTGTVYVSVINAHGLKEPFKDVLVELVENQNDTAWMSCRTKSDGVCTFQYVKEGSYYLRATPPGAIEKQRFDVFDVKAGETVRQNIEVVPKQLKLTVLTEVVLRDRPIRKQNVNVRLWNADFEEVMESKKSGTTRKVEFVVDKGTKVFVSADYVDENGKKYGPVQTAPFVMEQDKEITMTLRQIREKVYVTVTKGEREINELVAGEKYNAKLMLSLPYSEGFAPYSNVEFEMFVGEPGEVGDIERTPLVIDPISLQDIATEDPYIEDIYKSDEYFYNEEPKREDKDTSKYIKISIGEYTRPMSYSVNIPLYVKELASGKAKINYRATWTLKTGEKIYSNEGMWETIEYNIKAKETQTNILPAGPFVSYSAYLSESPEAKPTEIRVSRDALFYLHINAKARLDTDTWSIPINNLPDKAEGVSYYGEIIRKNGKTTIPLTTISGSDFEIKS